MDNMPRPRPPFLSREVSRHGRAIWYVRRNGKRIRLRADFGTPEFDTEYQAALTTNPRSSQKGSPAVGTLAWLIERYRNSSEWTKLSLATRRQREHFVRQAIELAGNKPIGSVTATAIKSGIERRSKTPAQARHFLEVMRGLFRWAHEAGLVTVDPTAAVKDPKRGRNAGYRPWTEDDVAAYERRWPIGTRQRVRA